MMSALQRLLASKKTEKPTALRQDEPRPNALQRLIDSKNQMAPKVEQPVVAETVPEKLVAQEKPASEKSTSFISAEDLEWNKEVARRNDPTLAVPMGGVAGGPLGGGIKEYEGLQDDVQKFYEAKGKANPEDLVRTIGGNNAALLREELQRRGDFKLDRLNPVSEVPDVYDAEGNAVPLHRRPQSVPTLSPERYKAIESDIKAYESGVPKRADGFAVSSDDIRNIAKRIESTDNVAEQDRLRNLRSELKKRGTYKEERFLETRESPEQKAEITAAKPIVEQYKAAARKVEDAPSELNFTQYDLTRDFDNKIAAEQDLTKKKALLEARRQLKEAKYIDDDESSLGKEVLASFGTGANMLAKGGNELARWGMKGLYALANESADLPPELRNAIDLEKIGRANDERELMQNLDFVSQKLQENAADLASAREDANPGITARREKIMAATGFVDAIKKSLADPGATLGIIGDSLPLMAAGGVAGKALAGAAGATTASGMVAGQVAGEALVAGAVNASSVREQLMQPDVQEQLKTLPEWGIALDAAGGDEDKAMRNIVDMAAGTAGVTSAGLTAFFGKLMSGVNAQIAGAEVRRGVLPYARSVLSEGGQELGQEGGDKLAENTAVRTTGIKRDLMEGVPAAAGMGAVMGSGMAAGIAAPQILGGQAEEDARILSLAADRDRMRLKELEDAARERHSVVRAAPTGDPDIDAGNALAEDAFQAARDRPSALDLQEKQEADELRTRLAAITSIADQQAASQSLDQTVDQRILDPQQEATDGLVGGSLGEIAGTRRADGAIDQTPQQPDARSGIAQEGSQDNGIAGSVVAGGIDQAQGAVNGPGTSAPVPIANTGLEASAQRAADLGSQERDVSVDGRLSEVASDRPIGAGPEIGINEPEIQRGEVTDDLRTPDAGAVEAPQTVDQNLVELADLLLQEGSTDPLPPEGISDEQAEIIPSLESEIGWDQRGGGIVRDEEGKVTGRLPWIARPSILGGISDFWRNRPEPITEQAASKAIQKFRNGERLAPIERRFVAYAGQYAQQIAEENQAYNEASRAASREPKTFTAPDGAEIRYSKPMQIAEGNDDLSALARLTSRPEAFQTTGSKTKNLSDLVSELMPKASLAGWNSVETEGGRTARELTINLPPNNQGRVANAKILDDGKSVWIDVSDATQGQGAGTVYNIAAQYAANNGRKFIQDPSGLSDDGAYRRVSQLLSQVLKQGTTANVDPGERLTSKDRLPVRRIRWSQDDTSNLRELTDAEVQNTFMQVPEVAGFAYDFESQRFVNDDGETVSDKDFKRIAEAYRASGRGPVRRKGNSDGSFAPIGGTTLKRAVLLDTISREAGGSRWNGILDAISRQQATGLDPQLKGLFYSKSDADSVQPKGDARKAAEKAWGKRLIDKLTRNGILTFVSRDDVRKMNASRPKNRQIDVTANAFVDESGKAFVINENVSDDMAPGIVLHEVGVHFGLEAMVGTEVFQKILADLRSLRATDKRVQEAYDRVPKDTPEKYVDEEALAYMAEMSPKHGLIQRLIDALVTFFKRIGFQNEGFLNESRSDEMLRIIRNSLRNAGKPKASGVVYSDYDTAYSQPQSDQTKTTAFRRWFGDSKVVDADGKPRIVYHGSPRKGLESIKPGYREPGAWFTLDKNYANDYAKGPEGEIYEAYLSIKNPMVVKFKESKGRLIATVNGEQIGETDPYDYEFLPFINNVQIVEYADENGYDGVHFPDGNFSEDSEAWVALDPRQIKSATENVGDFDPQNPGIRYSTPRSPSIIPAQQRAAQNRQTLESGLGANPQQPSFVASDLFNKGWRGWLRGWRESLQDKLVSALYVQNDIEAAGRIIEESADVHARENFMHGRVGNVLEQDERNYIAPLRSFMRDNKLDYKMLDDYLEARHAEERNREVAKRNAGQPDGGSGMTTEQANNFLNGTDDGYRSGKKLTPELKRKMDRAATYVDRLLEESRERMIRNGLITQEQYNGLQKYRYYVPLKEELDGQEMGFGGGRGSGVDARPRAVRGATGRGEGNRAGDILSHALGDTQRLVVLGEKARVGRALARLVLDNPNKDLWEIEPVVTEQKLNTAGEVYIGLQNLNNDPLVMVIKFEGKPYKIKFGDNPVGRRLAAALKNMNPLNAGAFTTVFGGINRFYSKMMTSYSPSFIVVNLMRDLFYGTSGLAAEKGRAVLGNAVKNYLPAWRSIWRYSREKGAVNPQIEQYRKEFFEAGGLTYFNEGKQAEDYQQDAERFMKGYLKLMAEGSPIQALTKFVEENRFMKLIHDSNNVVENTLRFAAFIALRETKTAAHPNGESVEQAAKYAKNMTVNFNRKGSASTLANSLYIFFNAAVQGAHRTIKLLGNRKVKATMAAMFGLQATFAMLLAGTEDDDGVLLWDKIPNQVKEKNLIIPTPWTDEGYITIPMPYGFNIFPYAGGRIGGDVYKMMDGDKLKPMEIASDIATATLGSFSPINVASGFNRLIPTLPGQLLSQSRSNESTFGSPIRDKFLDDKQARAYQGKPQTSMFYNMIAQALNKLGGGDEVEKPAMALFLDHAPEDIEFMVENLGGGPLRFVSQAWSAGESLFTGAESGWGDVPLISAIIPKPSRGSGTQRVFYDQTLPAIKNDSDKIKGAAKRGEDWQDVKVKPEMEDSFKIARKKDGTRAKPPKGSLGPKIEPVRGSLPDLLRKTEKEIRRLRDDMRAVRNDSTLSFTQKKLALEKIRKEMEKVQGDLIKEQRIQRREARKQQ